MEWVFGRNGDYSILTDAMFAGHKAKRHSYVCFVPFSCV